MSCRSEFRPQTNRNPSGICVGCYANPCECSRGSAPVVTGPVTVTVPSGGGCGGCSGSGGGCFYVYAVLPLVVSQAQICPGQSLTVSHAPQVANVVLAGPEEGIAQAPTFRPLVLADMPGAPIWVQEYDVTVIAGDPETEVFRATLTRWTGGEMPINRMEAFASLTSDATGSVILRFYLNGVVLAATYTIPCDTGTTEFVKIQWTAIAEEGAQLRLFISVLATLTPSVVFAAVQPNFVAPLLLDGSDEIHVTAEFTGAALTPEFTVTFAEDHYCPEYLKEVGG